MDAILRYRSFLEERGKETKEEFLNLLKGLGGGEVPKIIEDVENLSSEFVDNGFVFEFDIDLSSVEILGGMSYTIYSKSRWCVEELINKGEIFLNFAEDYDHVKLHLTFSNKEGDSQTNVLREFTSPFIKRLRKLHPQLRPIGMQDATNGKGSFVVPTHMYDEFLDECSSTYVRIVLLLNQS